MSLSSWTDHACLLADSPPVKLIRENPYYPFRSQGTVAQPLQFWWFFEVIRDSENRVFFFSVQPDRNEIQWQMEVHRHFTEIHRSCFQIDFIKILYGGSDWSPALRRNRCIPWFQSSMEFAENFFESLLCGSQMASPAVLRTWHSTKSASSS